MSTLIKVQNSSALASYNGLRGWCNLSPTELRDLMRWLLGKDIMPTSENILKVINDLWNTFIVHGDRNWTSEEPGRPRRQKKKNLRPIIFYDDCILSIYVMCINSTIGPECICPTLLVFGATPKISLSDSISAALPHAQMMMMMNTTWEKYLKLSEKRNLNRFKKHLCHHNFSIFKIGDEIFVYREKTGKWDQEHLSITWMF